MKMIEPEDEANNSGGNGEAKPSHTEKGDTLEWESTPIQTSKHPHNPNINKIPRRASRRSAELICEADGKFQPSVYIDHLSWSTPAWVVAKILDSTWKLRVQLADSARHETGPTIAFYWQKYREMKMKMCSMSLKNQLGV